MSWKLVENIDTELKIGAKISFAMDDGTKHKKEYKVTGIGNEWLLLMDNNGRDSFNHKNYAGTKFFVEESNGDEIKDEEKSDNPF